MLVSPAACGAFCVLFVCVTVTHKFREKKNKRKKSDGRERSDQHQQSQRRFILSIVYVKIIQRITYAQNVLNNTVKLKILYLPRDSRLVTIYRKPPAK